MQISKFMRRESRFIILLAIFLVAAIIFQDRPKIAMWIGFALAGYSAIANDSIQTLGTFLASNNKVKWWILWIFIGGGLAATLIYGWNVNSGDIAFDRLNKIPQPETFNIFQLLAPISLLILTRFKMPVSTTFLLLSVFSSTKTIEAMLTKTFVGYFVSFVAALVIWALVAELQKRKFFKENYNKKAWRVFQWITTAYLWSAWLMHDIANVGVFLPRTLGLQEFIIVLVVLLALMGYLLYRRGGRIQEIITEKTDVIAVRSATIIDLVFATILVIFKEWNDLPMSTTWVFLGMLAGREVALSRISGKERPYLKTLGLVMKDLALASIGLVVSLILAFLANSNTSLSDLKDLFM